MLPLYCVVKNFEEKKVRYEALALERGALFVRDRYFSIGVADTAEEAFKLIDEYDSE